MSPSTRWIWSRQAWVASRAEASRRASLAVNSEMVSWFNMGEKVGALFDDLRHQEEAVGLGGGIAQCFLRWQRGADFVGPGHVDERDGVGGGLDLADVQLLQLLDIAEDAADLRAELLLLRGRG